MVETLVLSIVGGIAACAAWDVLKPQHVRRKIAESPRCFALRFLFKMKTDCFYF